MSKVFISWPTRFLLSGAEVGPKHVNKCRLPDGPIGPRSTLDSECTDLPPIVTMAHRSRRESGARVGVCHACSEQSRSQRVAFNKRDRVVS